MIFPDGRSARASATRAAAMLQDGERLKAFWRYVGLQILDEYTDLTGLHPRALVESALWFRKRGIFITSDALVRV